MAIQTYIVPTDRMVHETKVDFKQRCVQKTVHIVQYDKSLPIVAVKLFLNGSTYTLPANADVKIRWGKRDRTFVYKNVLGCDENRQIVYFDVDDQMTFFNGPCNPILEVIISGNKAGSSAMPFEIDRNPIQVGDIESHSIYPELEAAVERAEEAAKTSSEAAIKAVGSEAWAVGTIDGVPVPDYDPRYHNNSKWYAEQAGAKSEHVDSVSNSFDERVENAKAEITNTKNAGISEINTIRESSKTEISTIKEQATYDMEQKAEQTIETIPPDYTELSRRVDHKADIDGYYEGMGVGTADNLISPDGITDTPENDETYNPFVFRSTAGSKSITDGNAVINEIRGDNLKWNQLAKELTSDNWFGQRTFNDNVMTFSPTSQYSIATQNTTLFNGHKYLISTNAKSSNYTGRVIYFIGNNAYVGGEGVSIEFNDITSSYKNFTTIGTYNQQNTPQYIGFIQLENASDCVVDIKDLFVVDLTDIFSVGNEPTDVNDPRVQFLINYANLHPEYNTGSILSVKPESMKAVGFNAWDGNATDNVLPAQGGGTYPLTGAFTTKYFRVVPGASYYANPKHWVEWCNVYDSNKNFIVQVSSDIGIMRMPNNAVYAQFGGRRITDKSEACINLSWSGYRNGEYEAHKEFNRDLPVLRYFPDGMNGINGIYDVLNFKTRKGVRRFGIVDLGTLNWTRTEYNSRYVLYASNSSQKLNTTNYLCSKYISTNDSIFNIEDKCITGRGGAGSSIWVRDDSYTDATTFKTAMSGVYLIYELAVPEEFNIDPTIDTTYEVSDFGTEEFVGGDALPVPCEIFYQDNLRDKLRNLNSLTEDELQEILDIIH